LNRSLYRYERNTSTTNGVTRFTVRGRKWSKTLGATAALWLEIYSVRVLFETNVGPEPWGLVGYVSHLLFAFFRCPVTSASIGVHQCRKISRKTTTVIL